MSRCNPYSAIAPLLCASPPPVVARFCPSASANTCIMTMMPSMPMTMPTMISTKLKPSPRDCNRQLRIAFGRERLARLWRWQEIRGNADKTALLIDLRDDCVVVRRFARQIPVDAYAYLAELGVVRQDRRDRHDRH